MKKFIIGLLLLVLLIVISSFSMTREKQKVSITVSNIKKQNGTIYVSVFQEQNFLDKGKEVVKKGFKVNTEKAKKLTLYLDPGTYAIAIYYDANNNNKCDLNFLGIPTEQYAFSNNFQPFMSSPNFNDCAFTVGEKEETLGIRLLN
ncbi:MAG: DUF2141 domain-containing protein [Flavobacteriales bacterium]|jgi:uncharacterized protein (DUF2141 family)|nr:DUF2141 domain-containing protein [Flavobacteriales bacterium]